MTWRPLLLAALAALSVCPSAAGRRPRQAEWVEGMARSPAVPPLPPRHPDAEVFGPITDPRPIIDGNYPVDRDHRLASFYENDKPRLPPEYERRLLAEGLTPEQVRYGTRVVRPGAPAPPSRLVRAPPPVPLPGGLELHLVPDREPAPRPERKPAAAPRGDLYPAVQEVPAPALDLLPVAEERLDQQANEVEPTAAGTAPRKLPQLPSSAAELRRHHRRLMARLDRHMDQMRKATPSEPQAVSRATVMKLRPGVTSKGRRVSYRRVTHSYSSSSRPRRLAQRRRRYERRQARWGAFEDRAAVGALSAGRVHP